MYFVVIILLITSLLPTLLYGQLNTNTSIINFGKTYTGVTFQPYVKSYVVYPNGTFTLPDFNSYSLKEIDIMLRNISTRFNSIATYSMGVDWYNINNTWNNTDSNCLIAKAAAELNLNNQNLTIKVAQGIHQKSDPNIERKEIENALISTLYANTIYPGTVWGLIFMNQAIDDTKVLKLLEIIKKYRNQTNNMKIKIGPKIQNCEDVINIQGPNHRILLKIVNEVDFIMCNQYPKLFESRQGPEISAQSVIKIFQSYSKIFMTENPNVEIILGETGWPSKGRSFNGETQNTTIENLKIYWTKISELSNQYKIRTYLLGAFDEPWKSNYGIHDPNQHDGRNGAEGHFGWFRRVNNEDIYSNVEKIYEPQEPVHTNEQNFEKQETEMNGGANAGLIAGIVVGLVLLLLIVVIFSLFKRLQKAKMTIGRLTELEIEEFEKGMSQESAEDGVQELALLLPYDRNYEIPKSKLIIEKHRILGKGQFGMVYKGKIDGMEDEVAFKTVKTTESSDHLKSLLSELKIMIYIGKHENVIGLLGAYTAELRDGIAYIAAEFCSLGSLEKYLKNYSHSGSSVPELTLQNIHTSVPETSMNYSNSQGNVYTNTNDIRVNEIPLLQLIKWSHQIANGMEWLASKKVIHADLAARNVLLTANKTVKITDFGLSRRLYEYTTYVKESQEPLPWRWMAIESLRSMNFSTQSDVWSYGITLWEIFSLGDIPYPGLSWHIEFVKDLEKGLRLCIPKYATELIFDKMLECWRSEPNQRPNFSELISFFNELELY